MGNTSIADILASHGFVKGLFSVTHTDIDGPEFRQFRRGGGEPSIQIKFDQQGNFYADVDAYYAYNFFGFLGHFFGEVVAPRLGRR